MVEPSTFSTTGPIEQPTDHGRATTSPQEPEQALVGGLFPPDTRLLPLRSGALLVSPSYALFCPIGPANVARVEACLGLLAAAAHETSAAARAAADPSARASVESLPHELRAELVRHGFGGPPRPAEPEHPGVQIQLTNACNLACSYCCTNSGLPRAEEVNREQMFAVVDDVREVLGPGASLGLLGGEPLLVPWALELAEYAVERGLRLTLFTNGVRLADDEIAKRVAKLVERGAQVRVSLAATNGELCDRISGAPRFEQAVAGICNLHRHGAEAMIDLMLLPQHVDEMASEMAALRKLLPPRAHIALGVLYLSGREQGEHLFGSRAELEQSLDRIAFEGGETIAAPATSPTATRREGCSCALGHHLHVRSDGALFTCFKMEERVGDLRVERFADSLRSLRQNARPVATLPYCRDCPFATLCGGGCRTENLQYTGDADLPVCGPWRVAVLGELLAEDRVTALEWPAPHLLAEAQARGIAAPERLVPAVSSRHLLDT